MNDHNIQLIEEAERIRQELLDLGWYAGIDVAKVGIQGAMRATELVNRLAELGDEIIPESKDAADMKVHCLLEGATRGSGDEGVIDKLVAMGFDALNPILNLIMDRNENSFRRRVSIVALSQLKLEKVDPETAAIPLIQVLRNPWGDDFKVLVMAIRAVGDMGARNAINALEEFPLEVFPEGSFEADTLANERTQAIAKLK